MFCPRCGQQQLSGDVRFCAACGLPLNVVTDVVASGGQLPPRLAELAGGPRKLSPRQKGVRQGAMLMLSTLLIVPLAVILGVFVFDAPEIFAPIAAITCFVGGFLRIMYAVLLEEKWGAADVPGPGPSYMPPGVPSYMNPAARGSALPPPTAAPASYPPRRADAGEPMQRPPSVTENTTRLLGDLPEDPPAR